MAFINTVDIVGDSALMDLILSGQLTELHDDNIERVGVYALIYSNLVTVDIPNCQLIQTYSFYSCASLKSLILRCASVVTLENKLALDRSGIAKGTGYIYVPRALVDSYKAATNWSAHANQFRALEDYTVDGTVDGELDESKI